MIRSATRAFRNALRAANGQARSDQLACTDASSGALFDLLTDDCVALIFRELLVHHRVNPVHKRNRYFNHVATSSKAVAALALACRRLAFVLRAQCPELQAEALARVATPIVPQRPLDAFSHTDQLCREFRSCNQHRLLVAAQRSLACHCAKDACCRKHHRAFNRDARTGSAFSRPESPTPKGSGLANRIVAVLDNCSDIAPASDANVAFVYQRARLSKRQHGEHRTARFADVLLKMQVSSAAKSDFFAVGRVCIDDDVMSAPVLMRASPSGAHVVFVRANHAADAADEPYSRAFVWTGGACVAEVDPPANVVPGVDSACLSAQDAFFYTECGVEHLVVCWSSDWVHESGHFVGSNAVNGAAFTLSTYMWNDGAFEFCESTFPESGRLFGCSPASDGRQVAVFVKTLTAVSQGMREVRVMNLRNGGSTTIVTNQWMLTRKGPVCMALSPSGDAVACVHRTQSSILFSLHRLGCGGRFVAAHCVDVSHHLGLSQASEVAEMHTDLVKQSIDVQFSPCGRFVAVSDRHPRFGQPAINQGALLIDTVCAAARGLTRAEAEARPPRPVPLFGTIEQAPRSLKWTTSGVWLAAPGTDEHGSIGARGGLLCLR